MIGQNNVKTFSNSKDSQIILKIFFNAKMWTLFYFMSSENGIFIPPRIIVICDQLER